MTNEQLDEYESLDKAHQAAHDNLTEEVMLLARMRIGRNELVLECVARVEREVASINARKSELIKASGDKMAFFRTI